MARDHLHTLFLAFCTSWATGCAWSSDLKAAQLDGELTQAQVTDLTRDLAKTQADLKRVQSELADSTLTAANAAAATARAQTHPGYQLDRVISQMDLDTIPPTPETAVADNQRDLALLADLQGLSTSDPAGMFAPTAHLELLAIQARIATRAPLVAAAAEAKAEAEAAAAKARADAEAPTLAKFNEAVSDCADFYFHAQDLLGNPNSPGMSASGFRLATEAQAKARALLPGLSDPDGALKAKVEKCVDPSFGRLLSQ